MQEKKLLEIKEKALQTHIPIIMDDTLEEIEKRMKQKECANILEIGTAVGYSAICFTKFLTEKGQIDTIEKDEERVKQAKQNIKYMRIRRKNKHICRRCSRNITKNRKKI